MVRDGPQSASTVRVSGVTVAGACRWPGTLADFHTCRARSPLYQPILNALTWKVRAVVDAYKVMAWPGRTLAAFRYPIIASGAPWWRIAQFGSPGSEFSGGEDRGDGFEPDLVEPASELDLVQAATAVAGAATAAAASAITRRLVGPVG